MITVQIKLVEIECYSCSMTFAMPQDFYGRRRRDHQMFYCPTGHAQRFIGQSEEERLKSENERLGAQLRQEREQHVVERTNRRAAERSLVATRGHLTRARRRAAAGVCPACTRTFQNVARHVATQHPDFKPDAPVE